MPTREQIYREQLTALGIYNPAFEPLITDLAQMDRRWTRAKKEWAATAPPGGKPSFLDPTYAAVTQIVCPDTPVAVICAVFGCASASSPVRKTISTPASL